MTIFNGEPVAERMLDKINEAPFSELRDDANDFLKKYGFTVEAGDVGVYEFGGSAATRQELESFKSKSTLINVVKAFSNVPQEYVEMSRLKRFCLLVGSLRPWRTQVNKR